MTNHGGSSLPPNAKSSSMSMLRENLGQKADEKWVKAKIDPLKEDIDETKKIALSARKKAMEPHECTQDEAIKDMMKAINGWKNVKILALISVGVVIVGVIGQFFALKDGVEDNQAAITDVQDDVAQVKGSIVQARIEVQEVKSIVEDDQKSKVKQDKKQIQEIKSVIKEALEEAAPRRRNR